MVKSLINRLNKLLATTLLLVVVAVPMAQAFNISGNTGNMVPLTPYIPPTLTLGNVVSSPLSLTDLHLENDSGSTVTSFDAQQGGILVYYTLNTNANVQVTVTGNGYQKNLQDYSSRDAGVNYVRWAGKVDSVTPVNSGTYTITVNAQRTYNGADQTASAYTTVNVGSYVAYSNTTISNVHVENAYGQTVTGFDPHQGAVKICYDLGGSYNALVTAQIYNNNGVYFGPMTTAGSVAPGTNLCSFTWYGTQGSSGYVPVGSYTIKLTTQSLSADATAYGSVSVNYNTTPVDTTPPSVQLLNGVQPNPTTDTTPDVSFWTSEAGTIEYDGACVSTKTSATQGDNIVTFNPLANGTYTNCRMRVRDAAGNASGWMNIPTFTIQQQTGDTTSPVLSLVNGVQPNPTTNTTPSVTFSSTEGGTIYYDGACSSSTNIAYIGNNTVTFNQLAYGTYSNCSLRVKDTAGNYSAWLNIPAFTVQQGSTGDTTAPVLSNPSSIGTVNTNTPSWSFTSSEAGTIAYYGSCSSQTTAAVSGNNTVMLNYLANGTYSNCYITVRDAANNVSAPLYIPAFTVNTGSNGGDTTPPVLSNPSSIGTANTNTPSWSFTSSEAGTIAYYGSCSSQTTSAVNGWNTVTLNYLANGTYSNCYITVRDAANNVSSALYIPAFTVSTGSSNPGAPNITSYNVSRSPFDPTSSEGTYINYTIDKQATVTVQIFNGGSTVRTLVDNVLQSPGSYNIFWNGRDLHNLVVSDDYYTYRITASNSSGSNQVEGSVQASSNDNGNGNNNGNLIGNLRVDKNYFNPQNNGRVTINWDVKKDNTYITLEILDQNGSVIRTLENYSKFNQGSNYANFWNGTNTSNNIVNDEVYKVRLKAYNNGDNESQYVYTEVDTDGHIIGLPNDNNGNNVTGNYGTLIDNIYINNALFNPNNSQTAKVYFDVEKDNVDISVDILDGSSVIRTINSNVNYDVSNSNNVYWNGRDRYNNVVNDKVYQFRITAERSGYSTEYAYVYTEVDTDGHVIGFPGSNNNNNNNDDYCAGYWDVPQNSPYCKAIELMNLKGIFQGYADGSFRPSQPINRAEATKVILLALGHSIMNNVYGNLGFRDVDPNAWYMPYLRTARALAIINGYPDGTFKPAKTLNRVELLKIFLEAADVNVPYCNASPYSDTPNNNQTRWYIDYVCYAARNGLMYGDGAGRFNPASPMTRGDVADLFYNFENRETAVAYYDTPYYY